MIFAPTTSKVTRNLIERQRKRRFSQPYFERRSRRFGLSDKPGSGVDGVYYRKGRIGYKVFRDPINSEDIRSCDYLDRIMGEYRMLWEARNSGYTPKPYGIGTVQIGNSYYPCIIMQHINGKDSPARYIDSPQLHRVIERFESEFDVLSSDHYMRNFIVRNDGKIFLIDLDPTYL